MGSSVRELVIGCGTRLTKLVSTNGSFEYQNPTTVDIDPALKPDIVYDLNHRELAHFVGFDAFDEIHAYDVLEHTGSQGDWGYFFAQFDDFWRILKPEGLFIGICPKPSSPWAWGDPGHTRIISPENLGYLDRSAYGQPPMTDYRPWFVSDWQIIHLADVNEHQYAFVLKAIKPARGVA